MLANVLAVLLGISSFTFYMAAFFYPEVHRRSDFVWSGLGMFYALVLWFCAGQMTPTVQLGQLVAVALLLGLGWQTLSVRREKTPVLQQTPVVLTPEIVGGWAKSALNQLRIAPVETVRPQLQTRTLTSATTERLRQSLDPRRRPTYDYEFVEDGLPEVGESLEDLSLEPSTVDDAIAPTDFLATDFLLEETEAEPVEALTYTAPPSAVGEVLEEVTPQSAEPDRVDFTEVTEVEPTTVEPTTTAPLEDAKLEEQPVKKELVEEPVAEKLVEEDPLAEEPVDTDDAAADDWGDSDWLDDDTVGGDLPLEGLSHRTPETPQTPERTSERTPEKIPTQPEKPSLLAAPIILVGWVKDVVASMTKPKPSKPMIEIPRRDSPLRNDGNSTPAAVVEREEVIQDNFDQDDFSQASASQDNFDQDNSAFFESPVQATTPVQAKPALVDDDWNDGNEDSNWDD